MRYTNFLGPLVLALTVAACGSSPTWEGYSPAEAQNLQALGLTPSEANSYQEMGFNSATIKRWYDAGFSDRKTITAWHDARFTAEDAGAWNRGGFSLKEAYEWKSANFSAEEAVTLSQQANAEKIRAIQNLRSLTPETYLRINDAARADPELRQQSEELYKAEVARLPVGG